MLTDDTNYLPLFLPLNKFGLQNLFLTYLKNKLSAVFLHAKKANRVLNTAVIYSRLLHSAPLLPPCTLWKLVENTEIVNLIKLTWWKDFSVTSKKMRLLNFGMIDRFIVDGSPVSSKNFK